jgi:hypothetical protein
VTHQARMTAPAAGTFVGMGIMSKVIKLGIAKKIYDEARKPENQRKIKEAVASFQEKRTKGQGGPQR